MEDEFLLSPSWYRVAEMQPQLRSHVEIHRHHYRGKLWYVLQDHASGRFQRLTPAAYQFIGLMNRKRTVREIWEGLRTRLGDSEVPTQEEIVRLLSQLYAADALQSNVIPDTLNISKRYDNWRQAKVKQNLRSPLFMRFPFLDPERFLDRFHPFIKPFFSWPGLVLWFIVVGAAVFQAGMHWTELTQNITDRVLAPKNLVILWITFPLLKAFHEFGHGFAVKVKGGEVHEMGIMLLVFNPIPYVDASAASAFHKKHERALVGAAGLLVEIFIAALAVFIWLNATPGIVRSIAFNVIFIAGVSSLLFNGNPLLRFDAYYILSDLIEIPNFGPRGLKYLGYLIQRYILRMGHLEPPPSSKGERVWFVIYSIASWFYRIVIFTGIILFIATKFFFVGVLLACWALFNMFLLPIIKSIKFLLVAPSLRHGRIKANLIAIILLGGVLATVALMPVPLSTIVEGVIWIPDKSFVRANTNGFVERFIAEPGTNVSPGDPLIQCSDPILPVRIKVLKLRLEELGALHDASLVNDRVKAAIVKEEMGIITAKLEDALARAAELTITSSTNGIFTVEKPKDLPGRFLQRGELVGYVLNPSETTAQVVVSQSNVDFVRNKTKSVSVRLPEKISETLPAVLLREIPAATSKLPSLTLSQLGGGEIALDPRQAMGAQAYQRVFLFDIKLPSYEGLYNVGGRIYVRFDHGREPLVWRLYRSLRQVFLKRFNI